MRFAAAAIALTLPMCAHAREFKLLDLKEASVNYKHFAEKNRAPLFDGPQKERVSFNLNTDVANILFFNNRVHGTTTSAQYYLIGWEFSFGIRISKYIDFMYAHHSQHLLDRVTPGNFPVEDSLGATIYFFRTDKADTIW